MSDLLNQASLVMIPSGYKEDTVYSQVPQDGSGDLSFTRASNGTRINSAGLVEVCPWNLLQQSETFENAVWNKVSTTVVANAEIAPNGTTTADTMTVPDSTTNLSQGVSYGSGEYTFSVYVKVISQTTGGVMRLQGFVDGGNVSINFTPTTEWQLFTATFNATTSIASLRIRGQAFVGTLAIWGAQLNIGSTAKPYFPTTDRLNVPRLTYQNGGGGCPSLLLEPQRTNLALYSEEFDNAYWNKLEATITANTTNSPSGILNADSLIESTSNGRHMLWKAFTSVIGTSYTLSVFCKQNTRRYANINFKTTTTASPRFSALFDLQTGTNVSTSSVGTPTGTSFSIVPYGNGWYKISITMIAASISTEIEISASSTSTPTLSEGSPSYLGDGTSGIYLYGVQLEASSYPTSYIPTTSSSATRVADACFKTGISSLIGQSEGFIAGEVEGLTNSYGSQSTIMSVSDGTTQNRVMFSFNATTGYVTPRIFKAGSTIFVNDFAITLTQKIKFAIGWGGGRAVCYVNGTQVQETTGLTFFSSGTLTRLGADDGAGSNIGIGKVGEYILGTTNLTNAQLQSLTL